MIDADPPSADWSPPQRFDDYEVLEPLGRGGMGRVYLGRDLQLDRRVALKFISCEGEPNADQRERFIVEARAIARLSHPNVVSVYRVGETDGRPYIAYELVAGRTLDRLASPLPWQTVLGIGVGLARGLEAVHRAGLVHRDVKPSNVIVSDDPLSHTGEVKLLDFGLAKGVLATARANGEPLSRRFEALRPDGDGALDLFDGIDLTRTGTLVGTPAYLAPEQWLGEPATARSDVWAAGLVLHELLTGPSPRAGLTPQDLARAMTTRGVAPVRSLRADVPETLAAVVDRCLRRAPEERFSTAGDLRSELFSLRAVFLPRGTNRGVPPPPEHSIAVQISLARIGSRMVSVVARFYEHLFAAHPRLRPLFPERLEGQHAKLAHALQLSVEGLRTPERITVALEDLGRRHASYGVAVADLALVQDVLVEAVKEFDAEAWSDELETGWRSALGFVTAAMRRGYALGEETQVSGASAPPPRASTPPPVSSTALVEGPFSAPVTKYARNGEARLAYQTFGPARANASPDTSPNSSIDVLVSLGWLSHVELSWAHPSLSGFLRHLSRRARVILWDKRGVGMSDRDVLENTLDERVEDMLAVLDAAGSKRTVLLGISDGAGISTVVAARHPERIAGLAIYGGAAKLLRSDDYPAGLSQEFLDQVLQLIDQNWGSALFVDIEAPSMAHDAAFVQWLGQYMRMSATPRSAIAMMRAHATLDIRPELPNVKVPTLVMHRTGDGVVPIAAGRHLAETIPGAELIELPGADHLPFVGEVVPVLTAIDAFLREMAGRRS